MKMEQKKTTSTTTARMVMARRNTGSKGGVFLQGSKGGPHSPLLPVLNPNKLFESYKSYLRGTFSHRQGEITANTIYQFGLLGNYSGKREMFTYDFYKKSIHSAHYVNF